MTRHEIAAWSELAANGRLRVVTPRADWPQTLAAAAARIAAREAAALSTQPATGTRPRRPAAPQGAPSRPSKR